MRITKNIILISLLISVFAACDKEDDILPSKDFRYETLFQPSDTANETEKELYNKYGVWVRMDFKTKEDVTMAFLGSDPYNRYPIPPVDEKDRASAYTYIKTLLGSVSEPYAKKFFPLEIFFVKKYGGGWWPADYKMIGRSRFVICWPNQMKNSLPEIAEPEYHYYQDSVLTNSIWSNLAQMITTRLEGPITAFAEAGNPYDGGEAFGKIQEEYWEDDDKEKMKRRLNALCIEGGYISGSGSKSFEIDFAHWLNLLVTESYDNIKEQYLDNSPKRAAKYKIIIEYFKNNGWDIQEAGNKYREMREKHPYPIEIEEED